MPMEAELGVPASASSGVGGQFQLDTARCLQRTSNVPCTMYTIACAGPCQPTTTVLEMCYTTLCTETPLEYYTYTPTPTHLPTHTHPPTPTPSDPQTGHLAMPTDLQRAARLVRASQLCSTGDELCANGNGALSQVVPQHRVKHSWDTVPAVRQLYHRLHVSSESKGLSFSKIRCVKDSTYVPTCNLLSFGHWHSFPTTQNLKHIRTLS